MSSGFVRRILGCALIAAAGSRSSHADEFNWVGTLSPVNEWYASGPIGTCPTEPPTPLLANNWNRPAECGTVPPFPNLNSQVTIGGANTVDLIGAAVISLMEQEGTFQISGGGALSAALGYTNKGTTHNAGLLEVGVPGIGDEEEFDNEAAGTFVNNGALVVFAKFKNSGSFGGLGSLDVSDTVENKGVLVMGGAMEADGDMTNEGLFTIAGGAATLHKLTSSGPLIVVNGSIHLENPSTASAPVTFDGGLWVGADFTVADSMTWSAGTLLGGDGATNIQAGAQFDITGSEQKELRARTLNLHGDGVWSGDGLLAINQGASLIVRPGGALSIEGDAQADSTIFPASPLVNQGTVRKTQSGGVTDFFRARFDNAAVVEVETGVLQLRGGGTSTGSFTVHDEALLDFAFGAVPYNWEHGTVIDGAGFARVSGVVNVPLGADVPVERLHVSPGIISGFGEVRVSQELRWDGGTLLISRTETTPEALLTITGGATKTLSGPAFDHRGVGEMTDVGALWINQGAAFNNHAGATFHAVGAFVDTTVFPAGRWQNEGLFTSDGETTFQRTNFNNAGGVAHVRSGNLKLAGGGVSSGTFSIDEGATLEFAQGPHTLASGSTISGAGVAKLSGTVMIPSAAVVPIENAQLAGGFLHGLGTAQFTNRLEFLNGTLAVQSAMVDVGATLRFDGDATKTITSALFENRGAAESAGAGQIWINQGAVLRNGPGATFHADGGFFDSTVFPSGLFHNQGEFVADGETRFFRTRFTNDGGLVTAASGNLRFDSAYVQTSGTTRLSGGTITSITPLDIQGGSLEGFGTIQGAVRNAGVVEIADSLTVTGGYTQTSAGTLNLALGSTTSSLLNVEGLAQIQGELTVALVEDFQPPFGAAYDFLIAGGGRNGLFDQENLPDLPNGLRFDVVYLPNKLRLDVLLSGDADGNGRVDVTDLNLVRNNFGTMGNAVPGDSDRNGVVDVKDLNAVRNYFGTVAASCAVAEPSACSLTWIAIAMLAPILARRGTPGLWQRERLGRLRSNLLPGHSSSSSAP